MIKLKFEKISRYERKGEFVEGALPFPRGALSDPAKVLIHDGDLKIKPQINVTAKWPCGSVKWLHYSFLADLPGNAGKEYLVSTDGGEANVSLPQIRFDAAGRIVNSGPLKAILAPKGSSRLFDSIEGPTTIKGEDIIGPVLASGGEYTIKLENDWTTCEDGPYRVIVKNSGRHYDATGKSLFSFTVHLHFTAAHPWFGIEYRFGHREAQPELPLEGLYLRIKESDSNADVALGYSNYQTRIFSAKAKEGVEHLFDNQHLIYEGNEHSPEIFYGAFFADWRKSGKGICASIFQAQQNFPKALKANADGMEISLMPKGQKALRIIKGMEKTHMVYLHLHNGQEDMHEINVRALQLQYPDRPLVKPEVFKKAVVLENVLMDGMVPKLETFLRARADNTGRAFGMLCWGDAIESGYNNRGRGEVVWCNMEYDFSHANMLMFARSGERRYYEKIITSAKHWMDIDICHHSDDPLRVGAHVEHCARHATGHIAPSHMWVEGLLDYYHITGDKRGFDSAIGIGDSIYRILETPAFQQTGELNARETGWALRTFAALYTETNDEKWLKKCDWILGHFVDWKNEYGAWLAPYTSHSLVRVPFMISVAAASLMRYYRIKQDPVIKDLIVSAMDDLLENAKLPDGQFYYKELPSLRHVSINSIILEALAYAWELTGDKKYLEGGLTLFHTIISSPDGMGGGRMIIEDSVAFIRGGTKIFSQSHVTLTVYTRALELAGMADRI